MFGSNFFGPAANIAGATTKGLTLSKILSGAGKTLNFVNKAIPMYYQIKPMLGNAKTLVNMYSAMKDETKKKNNTQTKLIENTTNITNEQKINNANTSNEKTRHVNDSLTFFQ